MKIIARFGLICLGLAGVFTSPVQGQSDTTQSVQCCDSSLFIPTYIFSLDADHGWPIYEYDSAHYELLLSYLTACPKARLSLSACTGTGKMYKRKGCTPEGPGDLEMMVLGAIKNWLVAKGIEPSRLTTTGWQDDDKEFPKRFPAKGVPIYRTCPVRFKLIACD